MLSTNDVGILLGGSLFFLVRFNSATAPIYSDIYYVWVGGAGSIIVALTVFFVFCFCCSFV